MQKKSSDRVKIGKNKTVSKAEAVKMRKEPGGSNVGKYPHVKIFAGPAGGGPAGSAPIDTLDQAESALKLAHNFPHPAGIRAFVFKHYPQLRNRAENKQK